MQINEQKSDNYLLSLWAGQSVTNVYEGYEAVRRQYRGIDGRLLEKGKAKSMVHAALERRGVKPKHSPSLIHAWTLLHRQLAKTGDLS